MARPLILVTTESAAISIRLSSVQNCTVLGNIIVERLKGLGCMPLLVPNGDDECTDDLAGLLDVADGLLLTTGVDIDPETYGQLPEVEYASDVKGLGRPFYRPAFLAPNRARDTLELALYRHAKQRGVPIFGICRGMQMINVAEGGSLHQEVPLSPIRHALDDDGWINYHAISIDPSSRCGRLLGRSEYFVSSIHHQSVASLGDGLRACAVAEDGVVEMLEHSDDDRFIIGVQGHVEKSKENLSLFSLIWEHFGEAASARQRARKV